MRPSKLTLTNFKSHESTVIDLAAVHVASITGANGAGKSTVLDAIVYGLYGPDGLGLGRRADTVIREGSDCAIVVLEFDVAGFGYQIERKRMITGKTVLELRARCENGWESLTQGTVKDTQAAIEGLVGCSAETFLQAVYVGQGDASRFAKATPAERKETLTQALDLDQYPPLQQAARDRARGNVLDITNLEQRIAELTAQASVVSDEDLAKVKSDVEVQRYAVEAADNSVAMARKAHSDARVAAAAGEQAREHAAALERQAAQTKTDWETARTNAGRASFAAAGGRAVAQNLPTLEGERPLLVDLDALEAAQASTRDAHEAAQRQHDAVEAIRVQYEATRSRYVAVQAAADTARERLADAQTERNTVDNADDHAAKCPTCAQLLDQEARARARETLTVKVSAAMDVVDEAVSALDDVRGDGERLKAELATAQADLPESDTLKTALQTANTKVAAGRTTNARHHELADKIATARAAAEQQPELDKAWHDATAVSDELEKRYDSINAEAMTARANITDDTTGRIATLAEKVATAESTLRQRQESLARLERDAAATQERVTVAQTAADAATLEQGRLGELKAQERIWDTITRAYGRDGIPAQVIRHARPQIEADANNVLSNMGAPYRIRIDLEKDTKAGTVQDTLDITILAVGHERPFDLLSGGEQYRVNVALRLAIGRVLANRSGKRIETLVLDEPEGLDAAGFSALADMIASLGQEFPLILTVSHSDGLEAVCDTSIRVTKENGTSHVEVAA